MVPDDEVINFIFALMTKRDSQLRVTDKTQLESSFFRTYFMTNRLKKGFEFDSGYSYDVNVRNWSQKQNLFLHNNFFPIHIVNRYCILTVIFIPEKCVQIFDRVKSDAGDKYLAIIFQYIKEEYQFKYGDSLPNEDEWNLVSNQPLLPSQIDNSTFNFCNR